MLRSAEGEPVPAGPVVWTIGHSTRSAEELIELLRVHGITRLADVRTVPRSRRNPQFNRDTLPETLRAAGIDYVHLPGLGGLRHPLPESLNTAWRVAGFQGFADYMQSEEFTEHIEELCRLAEQGRVAIMCAEAVPWRCHRRLIADALVARGLRVLHILSGGRTDPHALTPWARLDGTRISYPGEPPAAKGSSPHNARTPSLFEDA